MDQPSFYRPLTVAAQTAYAQLFEAALNQRAMGPSIAGGSFAPKEIKGKTYWYFQFREPGSRAPKQIYVGPASEALDRLRQLYAQNAAVKKDLGKLAEVAFVHELRECAPQHLRVIERLENYGFFRAGGVLVGTHAFLAMGNMLGARWSDANQTLDIDFAHPGDRVSMALPANVKIQTGSAIESLQEGFIPLLNRNGKPNGPFAHPKQSGFTLDFLTPAGRKPSPASEKLGIALTPVKMIEYLLEDYAQAVVFHPSAGVALVSIPSPSRYAVHKLMVSAMRPIEQRSKSAKDIIQAACIIDHSVHNAHDLRRLEVALKDAAARGKSWRSGLDQGLLALDECAPALAQVLQGKLSG